jgi:hypothetical protein
MRERAVLEEQLANVLQQRVGLGEEQARQAARTALEFLRERVPQAGPLLDMAEGAGGSLPGNLGGLLGGS